VRAKQKPMGAQANIECTIGVWVEEGNDGVIVWKF
jgi:hypothetical protein